MAKAHLLTGLTSGAVDTTSHEITFHLSVSGRAPFAFVAKHGPVAQMISGLSSNAFRTAAGFGFRKEDGSGVR